MTDRQVTAVCGGRPFHAPSRPPTVAVMAPVPNLPGDSDDIQDDAEAYVGLGRQEAEDRARARGWTTVRAVPPGAVITMEYLTGRINFEVEDGVVHRSWQG
ncbi:hypothetical protein GCM10010211_59020 [Streptomyces albospinus]|uniref:Proteinase inhibitor I78 n=2 Tax=Streptomyces albospinus TaxID=285515 RepID=A0ABQ2VG05_9ACTN|nr:hypothetical protein GCM10010211_59020 [Streptomyces albospinus]